MKIVERKIEYTHNSILEQQIRKYGIRKLAREINVSPAYICDVLNNHRAISKDNFLKIIAKLPPIFKTEIKIKGGNIPRQGAGNKKRGF